MLEGLALQHRLHELLSAALGQDDMALGAVAEHNFLFLVRGLMFVIVAASTAGPVFVTNVLRVTFPARIHIRKKIIAIDLLHGGNGVCDTRIAGIFRIQLGGNLIRSLVFSLIFLREDEYGVGLNPMQPRINSANAHRGINSIFWRTIAMRGTVV